MRSLGTRRGERPAAEAGTRVGIVTAPPRASAVRRRKLRRSKWGFVECMDGQRFSRSADGITQPSAESGSQLDPVRAVWEACFLWERRWLPGGHGPARGFTHGTSRAGGTGQRKATDPETAISHSLPTSGRRLRPRPSAGMRNGPARAARATQPRTTYPRYRPEARNAPLSGPSNHSGKRPNSNTPALASPTTTASIMAGFPAVWSRDSGGANAYACLSTVR